MLNELPNDIAENWYVQNNALLCGSFEINCIANVSPHVLSNIDEKYIKQLIIREFT